MIPGQANNCYIFPGVGLGIVAAEARHVTDRMFAQAARALASAAREEDLEVGRIYPELKRIREVSARIGVAVAEIAFESGLAGVKRPASISELVEAKMWLPNYECFA